MLRVGPTSKLPNVLRSLGYDPEEVLRGSGVALSSFDSFDAQIPFRTQCEVVEYCARRVGCPHLGLLIGARCELRALGALGLLQKYSPDVGSALYALIRYQRYQVVGAQIELHDDGERTSLIYRIEEAGVIAREHLEDGVIAALCAVLRGFLGKNWNPLAIGFAHAAPSDTTPFRAVFGCPVTFASGVSRLTLRSRDLASRLGRHDPDLHDYLQEQLAPFATSYADSAQQVQELLQSLIPKGCVRAEQIAMLLNVHPRTLHRRLQDCGTSFQQLLDEQRHALALGMLGQRRMAVGRIAETLGYSEPSAFVRAFRRWSGMSPGEWRDAGMTSLAPLVCDADQRRVAFVSAVNDRRAACGSLERLI